MSNKLCRYSTLLCCLYLTKSNLGTMNFVLSPGDPWAFGFSCPLGHQTWLDRGTSLGAPNLPCHAGFESLYRSLKLLFIPHSRPCWTSPVPPGGCVGSHQHPNPHRPSGGTAGKKAPRSPPIARAPGEGLYGADSSWGPLPRARHPFCLPLNSLVALPKISLSLAQ